MQMIEEISGSSTHRVNSGFATFPALMYIRIRIGEKNMFRHQVLICKITVSTKILTLTTCSVIKLNELICSELDIFLSKS
jgi:hypothetical protein